jgi:predicted RNA binding protein YcfA (HicA-like mRNA interferase family)
MTKHSKRLRKARNNPKNVSYSDFISILDNEGYTVRNAGGSHRRAYQQLDDRTFFLTFAEPHGNKKAVHEKAVKTLFKQLDEIADLEAEQENEDD